MTTPLSSIQGLISGFNYQDLVTAIIAQARAPADRMDAEITSIKNKETALTTYRGLLDAVRSASRALRDGSALDATSATTSVLSGTRQVGSVTTTSAAKPATFTLSVESLAKAEKLSSAAGAATSSTTALGQTGSFTLNGQSVAVTATDTLSTLRDRINALNTGDTPTGVSASILTVSPTDSRLILTSNASGAAGIAMADTSGTVLQNLGFVDNLGAKQASAKLVTGTDALFRIDNVLLQRSTNVISDAIDGVTLTLTSDEAGATTQIEIGHFADAASSAMQKFVDSYNALVSFIKDQNTVGTTTPALYGDSMLRTVRSALPSLLLQSVGGAATDLSTMATAGVSLTRDGTLTFDTTTFKTAFDTRYDDLRTLFTERLEETGSDLTFVSSGGNSTEGSRNVNITTAATQATVATSGFAGVYNDGGTADTVTITDSSSGRTVDVTLSTGMTTDDIVQAMQTAFDTSNFGITASNDGGQVRLTHSSYGVLGGIAISTSGTGDGSAEAWSGPVSAVYGTDVAGTIDGEAATGSGQTLVGNSGTAQAGITVRYAGSATGAIGSVNLGLGSGARIERLLDTFLTVGTGSLDTRTAALDTRSSTLQTRVTAFDARLERRRQVLLATFLQMETSISRLKQQSSSLLGASSTSSK